ncbi:hypothetical protein PHYBOEH_001297 [Phytophthora boehmeriae]|uniref:BZIP domain-containing protein n=1 Tax=Phytophthora boehmeriae TaxID=109152 RepID=A0A8T1WZC0_9STRA|nr:hypothetical protein PHYBOEH_001297 [Phytophthora boehmeriae]
MPMGTEASDDLLSCIFDVLPPQEVRENMANLVDQNFLSTLTEANPQRKKQCKKSTENKGRGLNDPILLKKRKDQCRENQARYRNRRRQFLENLEDNVKRLKEDVSKLRILKQRILYEVPATENAWCVVAQYFELFRHGYVAPYKLSSGFLFPRTRLSSTQYLTQLEFLQATMAQDMTDGALCGVDALLENWRLLSSYHESIYVELKCLKQDRDNSLVATVTTSLTITENTLQNLYPHLLSSDAAGDEYEELSSLAAKLLNQRIVVPGSVRFDWDDAYGCIMRMESKADILTPTLRLVGTLDNVARVFSGALITSELRIRGT